MKFSERWLHEWVTPARDIDALAQQITMAGLEVDGVEPAAPPFSGVIVGRIAAVEPHPDADKLRVCQVDDGSGETVQVVCGAPNAREGLVAPFATVGARLPGDFRIKKARLRGVPSAGMLCSAKELGLAEDAAGLMELPEAAPAGTDLRDYLELDDPVVEVDLTPNRGDCLGLRGIAREVAVLNGIPFHEPAIDEVPPQVDDRLDVELEAPEACPRYCGRVVRDVDTSATTPLWLRERLRRNGVRPISPVVDVTNYVMLELGQPMHGFDLERIGDGLVVRHAGQGETVDLLDGKAVELAADELVIADHRGPLALAGIMGGAASGVTDATRHVFLESAFFAPTAIAGRARRKGLHTDSSHRFERGVDPGLQRRALERATALLIDICGGRPGPVVEQRSEAHLPQPAPVPLRGERARRLLGVAIDDEAIVDILERLGMQLETIDGGWRVTPPSFRFDIALEEDLVEELARIHGYDNIAGHQPAVRPRIVPCPETRLPRRRLRNALVDRGYREAITYSFVDETTQALLDPQHPPVAVANPISSEMSVMRTSLWPGLVKAAAFNLNRQQARVRLFEQGLCFIPEGGTTRQQARFGGVICGSAQPEGWANDDRGADFFDLKGDVEALLALAGRLGEAEFVRSEHPALHPGRGADIRLDGRVVGRLGALHPETQARLDIEPELLVFEIEESALSQSRLPAFRELPRYPSVRRDLALIVPDDLPVARVRETIRAHAPDTLVDVFVFDVYQGKGVAEGHRSVGFGLILQDFSRTLGDDDVEGATERILAGLREQLGVTLRD